MSAIVEQRVASQSPDLNLKREKESPPRQACHSGIVVPLSCKLFLMSYALQCYAIRNHPIVKLVWSFGPSLGVVTEETLKGDVISNRTNNVDCVTRRRCYVAFALSWPR